jgi:hypothetical protein
VYKTPEKSDRNDTAGSADEQNDKANKEGSLATQRGAKGHIPVKATVQDEEDNHFDAMEKVAKEIKAATKKTPSTDEACKKSGEATANHKGGANGDTGTPTATQTVAATANNKGVTNGETGTGTTPTVTLDYSDKTKTANSKNTGKYAHLTPAEAKAHMQERGDKMIKTKQTFLTTTKLEFNLANGATQFSVRQATTQVLLKMKGIDTTLKVKSTNDNTEWTDINMIPRDPTLFSRHFKVQEENPP